VTRPITLEVAKAAYPYRFTMEHVPGWARDPVERCRRSTDVKKYYAPQYRSDQEWYDNTKFGAEIPFEGWGSACYSTGHTMPLGAFLDEPYRRQP